MEYIFLFVACVFFSMQFIFQKLFEKRTVGGLSVCIWNQIISSGVMVLFLVFKSGLPTEINIVAFLYVLGYAFSALTCGITTIMAMECGKVSLVSTACLVGGMIIPFVYGIVALGETAGIMKWIGIVILCASLVPSLLEKEEKQIGSRLKLVFYCMLIFLTNGMVNIFSKMHQISAYAINENSFVMLSAMLRCVAAVVAVFIISLLKYRNGEKNAVKQVVWEIGKKKMTGIMFMLLIVLAGGYAVCNAIGNLFSLKCMVTMDASIQFPLLSAVMILLCAVFGRIFFGEKITKSAALGLLLSIVGIALFMFA